MEEGKQKKSRKTDDEAEIGQRQFNSDSVLGGCSCDASHKRRTSSRSCILHSPACNRALISFM